MKSFITALAIIFSTNSFTAEKDPVVAEVNGKKITKSELYNYYTENLKFVKGTKKVTLESSLDDLINRIVGVDKAKKNKLNENPAVVRKMDDILYHAQISKDLEPELKKIKVSDNEVSKYYKEHPEYRTAQILLRLPVIPSKEEVAKNFDKALGIYNEAIKNSNKFLEMAVRFSQASNAHAGGDLGYQPNTRLTPEFYASIKNKKVGFITKPFRTQYGIHIVKVLGVKTEEQIDKNMYKKIIYDIKRDKILNSYFAKNKAKAAVKVFKENLQ